ncbi:MAG: hypothetical protein MUD01_13475 [Chloroflexaceae bacterium]|nr:hypothetical protein [Chloroflexaceae bacterium]
MKPRSIWSRTLRVAMWVGLGYAVLELLIVLAFRLRIKPVLHWARVFNKHILNPAMMQLAGRRHWYAAVINHIGRKSGTTYATPVVAFPTGSGFIIPLPYGEQVDWLRNVLAAGWASITWKGTMYTVNQPAVVDLTVAELGLSPRWRRTFWLFGVNSFLQLQAFTRPVGNDAEMVASVGAR